MSDKLKQIVKNKNNLVVMVLLGVLLLVIALPVDKSGSTGSKEKNTAALLGNNSSGGAETSVTGAAGTDAPGFTAGSQTDAEIYAADMEAKLESALSQMAGVGRVKVVITMKSSSEKIVEKDEPVTRSNTAEEDSQGGNRNINNVDMGENTVFSSQSGNSEPYVVKVIRPEVEGVMVIAEGAGNGDVSKNITEAVEVLFNIEVHKIKIAKMKKE